MKFRLKRASNRNTMHGSMWFMHPTSFLPEYVRTNIFTYTSVPAELRGLRLHGGTARK